ncbi:MAG: hypothetical protein H6Q26_1651, partial [Bacteroidetes bacterium]|nr:hypothetical protein [Bacteroidota bacterium]
IAGMGAGVICDDGVWADSGVFGGVVSGEDQVYFDEFALSFGEWGVWRVVAYSGDDIGDADASSFGGVGVPDWGGGDLFCDWDGVY